ncbi:MAG: ABC transporter ATP-binding protein, partial [Trueperaceae bacterium]
LVRASIERHRSESTPPPDLRIRGLGKRFGPTVALDGVDLEVPGGALVCFLGPSGCGKTTLLRVIAGLEEPSEGTVQLGERDLTRVPVHRRGVGMVFQSYALFPHLTVAENVAYGLRIRGVPKRQRRARANELLALVKLPDVGPRRVGELSGGQRQRVAMARALALDPELFLLDEPLSALDAKLREGMQVELRRLQRELGITTVIVTHDQEEAMTMADRVVVMGENRVQQVGPPLEVYRHPVNRFVADFLGSNNFLPGRVLDGGEVEVLGLRVQIADTPSEREGGGPPATGFDVTVAVRPENLKLSVEKPSGPAVPGTVDFVRDLGRLVETRVRVGEHELIVSGHDAPHEGDEAWVMLPTSGVVVLRS